MVDDARGCRDQPRYALPRGLVAGRRQCRSGFVALVALLQANAVREILFFPGRGGSKNYFARIETLQQTQ